MAPEPHEINSMTDTRRHQREHRKFEWNVLVTTRENGYRDARRALRRYGKVEATDFHNVLALQVDSREDFLHDFSSQFTSEPWLRDRISRVMPMESVFPYSSHDEFERNACEIAKKWAHRLEGKSFHVRMHRRGCKSWINSGEEERFTADCILEVLQRGSQSACVSFTDPDFIIDIDTLETRAGLSIWSRDDLKAYPFLNLD